MLSIDPGLKGAIIAWNERKPIAYLPLSPETFEDMSYLIQWCRSNITTPRVIVIEKITPRPGQSIRAVSTSSVNWGKLLMLQYLLKAEIVSVSPVTWSSAMHSLLTKESDDPKKHSEAVAEKLFHDFLKDIKKVHREGVIDALLIGGWKILKNTQNGPRF